MDSVLIPPAVYIELPVESAPRVRVVCLNESEEQRLWHWLFSQEELTELIERALEIAQEQRAA